MSKPICWNLESYKMRLAIVELLGWATTQGKATATGRRIARTEWPDLTPAARRVLERAEIVEGPELPEYQRLAYGTQDGKWHLIGPDDRDYAAAIPTAEFYAMTEAERRQRYLAPSMV